MLYIVNFPKNLDAILNEGEFFLENLSSLNPLTSGAPSCARKKNHAENPVRPYAPFHKWLILIGCRLDTKSLGYLKYAET